MDETDEFAERVKALRPRLHRYCARMTGSAIHAEDVLQDTLVRALLARAEWAQIENMEAWLLRIAHNMSLDFLRDRSRSVVVPIVDEDDFEAAPIPEAHIVSIGFQTFLRLPELQRCAVILKDVLGHSIEEIAAIADCSVPAAKSALQRGRANLRRFSQEPDGRRLPLISDVDRRKLSTYLHLFQRGDFDSIRAMLAEDVKLELVNRLQLEGKVTIRPYFTRYAEVEKWRFALGAIEGQPAMLVFDASVSMARPTHFVLLEWSGDQIRRIRDFLFAPYALESAEWVRLG